MRISYYALAVAASLTLAVPASAMTCAEVVAKLDEKITMSSVVTGGTNMQETKLDPTPPTTASGAVEAEANPQETRTDPNPPARDSGLVTTDPLSGFKKANVANDVLPNPDEAKVEMHVDAAKTALSAGNEDECMTHANAALAEYGYTQ